MISSFVHKSVPKPDTGGAAQAVSFRGKILNGLFTDNWHFNIFYFLLLIAAASLPFTKLLMRPVAILMVLNRLIEWNWKERWQTLRREHHLQALIVFTLYYLVVITGFFYSANKVESWSDFECKLWFLVAPVVLLTASRQYLTRERICKVFFVFAIATVIHLGILFIIATIRTLINKESYFFYYIFSIFRHPSYVSMYAATSFFMILYFFRQRYQNLSLPFKIVLCVSLFILAAGIFCLGSKAGILVFCLLGLIWFFYLFNYRKRKIGWSIVLGIGFIGTVILLFTTELPPVVRFKLSLKEIKEHKDDPFVEGSTSVRLTVWKSAWEVGKKHIPWGVGTGDSRDELCYNAVKNNYTNLIGHHHNAHNQYLQSLLTLGIPGIITLLLYCLMPVMVSIRRKDMLYLSFSVIFILNMLVESMFETHAGADFIALFNILFYIFQPPMCKKMLSLP